MTRVADVTSHSLVWVEIQLRESKRQVTQKKREKDLVMMWQRFIQWCDHHSITPVTQGHFGQHGWSDGYTKKDAKRVIRWLRAQPELQ